MHIPPIAKMGIKAVSAVAAGFAAYRFIGGTKREKILSAAISGGAAYAASHFVLQMVPSQPAIAASSSDTDNASARAN